MIAFGLVLHFAGRKRFGFGRLEEEIRNNPFKRTDTGEKKDGGV